MSEYPGRPPTHSTLQGRHSPRGVQVPSKCVYLKGVLLKIRTYGNKGKGEPCLHPLKDSDFNSSFVL